MTLLEIEKWFAGYKLNGWFPAVSKMEWLINRVEELEANIQDPEWCCANHKKKLLERIKELETDLSLNKSMLSKQTDLAREAEAKAMEAQAELTRIYFPY